MGFVLIELGQDARLVRVRLVSEADSVDCMVTPNPREALTLERELIRRHKPKFNSLMTDDKSYPFIALTSEEAPRILYTRHPPPDATLWGPFPDAGAAKRMIQLLRRQFGVRDCPTLLPQGCLSMHIGLCSAPCITMDGYEQRVEAVKQVMSGKADDFLSSLQEDMDVASEQLEYEVAAQRRDLIARCRLKGHSTSAHQEILNKSQQLSVRLIWKWSPLIQLYVLTWHNFRAKRRLVPA